MSDRARLDTVKAGLADRHEAVLLFLWPGGKFVRGEFEIGDANGKVGGSLKISCRQGKLGVGEDFATGQKTGDLLDCFALQMFGGKPTPEQFKEVLRAAEGFLGTGAAPEYKASNGARSEVRGKRPTAIYHYTDAEGRRLVTVKRFEWQLNSKPVLDARGKPDKAFEQWSNGKPGAPKSGLPLFRLPMVIASDAVVVVEGEQTALALEALGICATSAIGGSSAPLEKTNWWPLVGKHVVVWPDNDGPGAKFGARVAHYLAEICSSVAVVPVPAGMAEGWDAVDAIAAGIDVEALLAAAVPFKAGKADEAGNGQDEWHAEPDEQPKAEPGPFVLTDWHAVTGYVGEPKPQIWLIQKTMLLGTAGMVVAAGDVGKSYAMLDLGLRVAGAPSAPGDLQRPIFGGQVATHGGVVIVTAEDGKAAVHRRLQALDPDGSRRAAAPHSLYVVALPDAGGPFPIVEETFNKSTVTAHFVWLVEQLRGIEQLRLVVLDPLQCFVHADVNADPAAATFVMAKMNHLAAELQCVVVMVHHVRKENAAPKNLAEARAGIRGSSALVDSARWAIVMWIPPEQEVRRICGLLRQKYQPNAVAKGATVKSNDGAERDIWTAVRQPGGYLEDYTAELAGLEPASKELQEQLLQGVAKAAADGRPMTQTGLNGVYKRRVELSDELIELSRLRLEGMVMGLLADGSLVMALHGGNRVQWLDVPGGQFGSGAGEFMAGANQSRAGRKRGGK